MDSGVYYTNPIVNPYLQSLYAQQYGVNMPAPQGSGGDLGTVAQGASKAANFIPYVGPVISAGLNMLGTWYQNRKQEEFYTRYMSPSARMHQMAAAGINPNAAAQGISGAPAPQMTAATPSGAYSSLGDQLGNSANTALTADVIRSEARKNNADAALSESLNVKQTIENQYVDAEHAAALNKLVSEGLIARSTANMIKVDEAYKGANAAASYQQLIMNLNKTAGEIENLAAQTMHEYAAVYQAMASAALSEAEIHKVFSDIGLNNATIERISHEVSEIDARTAATYQDIDESKARQALTEIQTTFQQDYYDIWQNTGFNWNSDIEKSVVGACANYQTEDAERIMKGLGIYIKGTGDARSRSADYKFDKVFGVIGDVMRLGGMIGAGQAVSGASFRRKLYYDNRGGTVNPRNLIQR